ncbi:hypothetical protein D477_014251 [Arthrobacter crystallopoietes BAB-32]|uniref:Uncharacterized protein n=1 Tax=Arthrobacter crystallopoietes BAB-32 TaxID=1246476 RepID=N1UWW9_9MICC|nr:hypothetical protein [Arthrobacter crystallopoietes]EMY33570.1 hypothetical protein D477_014251 [Arthrobacter crystallopoietes BAB-32]
MPLITHPLDGVENVRSKIGAFCDAMTAGESGTDLGKRINELHDELADEVRALREELKPKVLTTVQEVEHLPVGTIVYVQDKKLGDAGAWELFDDVLHLRDEDGDPVKRAWASAAYNEEKTAADLLRLSGSVTVLRLGDQR